MESHIVIGANFGDEGKGLVTDYLCGHRPNPIVIRFNGGAQAGHTVETNDGKRHIFHHLGAGTLKNVPTFLSKHFIVHPGAFLCEVDELIDNFGAIRPEVHVDQNAIVTTPYDEILNWSVEITRQQNNSRHGSCGMGINETVERNLQDEFSIKVKDLANPETLKAKLRDIRDYYAPQRAKVLTCESVYEKYLRSSSLEVQIIDNFIQRCSIFHDVVNIHDNVNFLRKFDTVIFEGAQGLLLDEHHQWFPHITRSRTGRRNACEILTELNIEQTDIYYVTRGYLTRHGAGPLPFETKGPIYDQINDPTNVPNWFQQSLRYAPLNIDLIKESIMEDIQSVACSPELKINVVVTCMDQLPASVQYINNNVVCWGSQREMLKMLSDTTTPHRMFISESPKTTLTKMEI